MPEGPEVRRAADGLAAALSGRRLQNAYFAFAHLREWSDRLTGRRVESVYPRGKAVLIAVEQGLTIYTHNQLYGQWRIAPRDALPSSGRQLRLGLYTETHACLLYSASDIEILDAGDLLRHPYLQRLGPDPLDSGGDLEALVQRCREPLYGGRRLGGLLLDQGFVAGLGNYLRSEILFVARLHPGLRLRALDGRASRRLALAVQQTAQQAYAHQGVTLDLRRYARLRCAGASYEEARFWVFDRQGLPCFACGARIERLEVANRRLYRCPWCQPEPTST